MRAWAIALTTTLLLSGAALAKPPAATAGAGHSALAAPVHQFFDSMGKGDMTGAGAAYAPGDVTIIDEVPPYAWHGPGALQAWLADLGKDNKARELTDTVAKLGNVIRTEQAGDKAYVVMSVMYTFKEHGALMHEPARLTATLT